MSNNIKHIGVIDSIDGSRVKVRIHQTSACAACKVAGHCNASEAKEKFVDVEHVHDAGSLSVGQEVVVSTSLDVARKALMMGFVAPFFMMVVTLMAILWLTGSEAWAALSALGILIPYYLMLWLFRDGISRQVSFKLE